MYETVSSVFVGIGMRARTESVGPEKMMPVLGAQEWFRCEEGRERARPRGSRVGVVSVWVFVRICRIESANGTSEPSSKGLVDISKNYSDDTMR